MNKHVIIGMLVVLTLVCLGLYFSKKDQQVVLVPVQTNSPSVFYSTHDK